MYISAINRYTNQNNCVYLKKQALAERGKIATQVAFCSLSDITRFSRVDETLYRGGRPSPEQIIDLKNEGISTIIDFSTEPFKANLLTEEECAKTAELNYFKLPFVSWENPDEETVNKFFDVIEGSKKNNEKVFIHCFEGRDRTGLFVELYKIRYGLSDAQTSIDTLIKSRYNFSENPLAISFIKDFAKMVSKK